MEVSIFNVPVIGHHHGQEVRIGTASMIGPQVKLELRGEAIEEIQKLLVAGVEIKAFHINIEMLAAQPKKDA